MSLKRASGLALTLCATLMAGCATLPSSGPTAGQVTRSARDKENSLGFRIVPIDATIVDQLNTQAGGPSGQGLATLAVPGRNDTIGPGDVLQIVVFEVGASLFGGAVTTPGADYDPSAKNVTFPEVVVDRDGKISIPYVGQLQVAGRTPAEVQQLVVQGLRGKSQNPQALVSVKTNIANRVFLQGDVAKPGPVELSLGDERVTDAIAIGGGTKFPSDDMIVRLFRGGRVGEERLSELTEGGPDDVQLVAGDRVEVLHRPRSFTVFGATTKVSQVAFEADTVSLAEAVARIGGPNDTQADARAVFLFRYTARGVGADRKPIIYRLDMMQAASYFLSTKFAMQDKDVIYVANAAANQPSKLISVLNQLFSPFVTARAIAR